VSPALAPPLVDLLLAVRARTVHRRGTPGAEYDWHESAGRDVTVRMEILRREQPVSLLPGERGRPPFWRLTRAGHGEIAKAETNYDEES
jgi:hypothetical protein